METTRTSFQNACPRSLIKDYLMPSNNTESPYSNYEAIHFHADSFLYLSHNTYPCPIPPIKKMQRGRRSKYLSTCCSRPQHFSGRTLEAYMKTPSPCLVSHYNPICICLNEPMSRNPSQYLDRAFSLYHLSLNYMNVNTIFIRKSSSFTTVPLTTNLNALAIRLRWDHQITVCSIYLPISQFLDPL